MGNLQNQIASLEQEARGRYNFALCKLNNEKHASWFLSLLNNNILPSLSLIGLESQLSRTLFQVARDSWQRMGPSVSDCLWIHPGLTRSIREIRKGILLKADERTRLEQLFKNTKVEQEIDLIKRSMSPKNLSSLLDDIYPSWIILPRAYSLLRENDGCCLMSYLQYAGGEKSRDFRKLIIRIVIEFLANYSLKFAGKNQPSQAVMDAVFYGYALMFWENLSHPPAGCEELSVYKNFLDWGKAFQRRTKSLTSMMKRTLVEMEDMEDKVFPTSYNPNLPGCTDNANHGFLIRFRHGKRGIDSVGRYFNISENGYRSSLDDRPLTPHQWRLLILLLQEIKQGYSKETKKTQQSILKFLERLKLSLAASMSEHRSSTPMYFLNKRFLCIINGWVQHHRQVAKPNKIR